MGVTIDPGQVALTAHDLLTCNYVFRHPVKYIILTPWMNDIYFCTLFPTYLTLNRQ
jgi:hypothetical protein